MIYLLNFINFKAIGLQYEKVFNAYKASFIELLPNLTIAIVVFFIFYGLGKFSFSFIQKRIQRRWQDTIAGGVIAASFKWGFYLMGFLRFSVF